MCDRELIPATIVATNRLHQTSNLTISTINKLRPAMFD
jgi:hypothetical protein